MSANVLSWMPNLAGHLEKFGSPCANGDCGRTQLIARLPGGRQGIHSGSAWFCSVGCFVMESSRSLTAMINRTIVELPRQPRLSMGLFLTSRGILTAEQLRFATERSHQTGDELEHVLLQLQLCTERQIAAGRSAQWGYPQLASEQGGSWVEAEIPHSLLREYGAALLQYSPTAKRIVIGLSSVIDHKLLASIERVSGLRVQPCFITKSELEEQSERIIAPRSYEEAVVETPGSVEKMARTLGRAAVKIAARHAHFESCRNHIWVRLSGRRGIVDTAFRLTNRTGEGSFARNGKISEELAITG